MAWGNCSLELQNKLLKHKNKELKMSQSGNWQTGLIIPFVIAYSWSIIRAGQCTGTAMRDTTKMSTFLCSKFLAKNMSNCADGLEFFFLVSLCVLLKLIKCAEIVKESHLQQPDGSAIRWQHLTGWLKSDENCNLDGLCCPNARVYIAAIEGMSCSISDSSGDFSEFFAPCSER